jgi:hypothetical protein
MERNSKLWAYLRRDKRHVRGWLQRIDAEIIGAILDHQAAQQIGGGCVEIGIHQGRTFLPLCLALQPGEKALAIDLFDDQSRNLDGSGVGNLAAFHANLDRFAINRATVREIHGSSEDVTPTQIESEVGKVRYFCIDGGHWRSIVQNDLCLAAATLADRGVIVLDDYCRTEWPEVTEGYALWRAATASDIVPFASGSNKLYLCRKAHAAAYRAALKTPFLSRYWTKTYEQGDDAIDNYRVELLAQDEDGLRGALHNALKIFRPEWYLRLFRNAI